jgi:hypothetical protein
MSVKFLLHQDIWQIYRSRKTFKEAQRIVTNIHIMKKNAINLQQVTLIFRSVDINTQSRHKTLLLLK